MMGTHRAGGSEQDVLSRQMCQMLATCRTILYDEAEGPEANLAKIVFIRKVVMECPEPLRNYIEHGVEEINPTDEPATDVTIVIKKEEQEHKYGKHQVKCV